MAVTLDEIDRTLLAALQKDADWSVAALAERVNLTTTPVEKAGITRGDPRTGGIA